MSKVVIICTELDMSAVSLSAVIDSYKFCKNNKHLKMSPKLKFSDIRALVPLYCFIGLVTSTKVPSCYKVGGKSQSFDPTFCACHHLQENQSWISSKPLDFFHPVTDYKECQVLCQVK